MPDGTTASVLERKAMAQRRALGAEAISVARALGRSMSIAADALWALSLSCRAKSDDLLLTDRALSPLPDDLLFVVLEKDEGPAALVALDRPCVTGLIEVQTLGKVTHFPLDDRPFTPTDAAMMAPLIDATLPRFGSMLAGQPEREHLQGYQFGALVEDAQAASLVLEADQVQRIEFDISLAHDARVGRVIFFFPEPAPEPDDLGHDRKGKYEEAMKSVPARMQAVLTRIHIPLSKARALKPGDVLEISPNVVTSATLVVDGGYVAAKGKMGQMNGFRAIRIGADKPLLHKPVEVDTAAAAPPVAQTTLPSNASPSGQSLTPVEPGATQDLNLGGFSTEGLDPADLL